MQQTVTSGIVLNRINYQEADRIITFLTSDGTKVLVIAKGVRKLKSKLAGGVELFSVCQITYLPGKSAMGTLVSTRLTTHYGNIVKSLDKTQWCYQLLKFLNKYTEEASSVDFYHMLVKIFETLNDESMSLDLIKAWFGVRFLEAMGHSPNLMVDQSDATKPRYRFDIDRMQFISDENGAYSQNQIKLLRLMDSNEPEKVNKVSGIDELLPTLLKLTQLMMLANGFNFN